MAQITIATAQRLIAKLRGRLSTLQQRAGSVCSYREDREPAFKFEEVMAERKLCRDRLLTLQSARTVANAATLVEHEGRQITLVEAVRRLEELKGEQAFYQGLEIRTLVEEVDTSGYVGATYQRSVKSVAWKSAVSEPERDRMLTKLSDEFEQLNGMVESLNHTTRFNWDDPGDSIE